MPCNSVTWIMLDKTGTKSEAVCTSGWRRGLHTKLRQTHSIDKFYGQNTFSQYELAYIKENLTIGIAVEGMQRESVIDPELELIKELKLNCIY